MKKNLLVLALVVLSGAFAAPVSVLGGDIWHNSGQNAYASFYAGNQCLYSELDVSVNSGTTQSPPGAGTSGTQVWMNFWAYDSCSGTWKGGSAYAQIAGQDFNIKVSGANPTATLTTTVQVYDYWSGSSYPVTINLTWNPTGPAIRQAYHDQFNWPGQNYNYNYRSSGTYRDANVTGTVSDGATNLTPDGGYGQFGTGRTMMTSVQ